LKLPRLLRYDGGVQRIPGIHKGLVDVLVLKDGTQVATVGRPTKNQRKKAEEDTAELVKAALLISGADKNRFSRLKDQLANNYLLGTDQYPDTFKKAMRILGNYQVSKYNRPFRGDGNESGMAFLQQGGRGRGHGGRGGATAQGMAGTGGANAGGSGGDASAATMGLGDQESLASPRTNQAGDSHCYNYGKTDHWAYECPDLTSEQQAQQELQEGHQLLNVSLVQGDVLPDNRAYLDGCSMVTAFKADKYLKGIRMLPHGIKINCNSGAVVTNKMNSFG
jgi:hypothetical protein